MVQRHGIHARDKFQQHPLRRARTAARHRSDPPRQRADGPAGRGLGLHPLDRRDVEWAQAELGEIGITAEEAAIIRERADFTVERIDELEATYARVFEQLDSKNQAWFVGYAALLTAEAAAQWSTVGNGSEDYLTQQSHQRSLAFTANPASPQPTRCGVKPCERCPRHADKQRGWGEVMPRALANTTS